MKKQILNITLLFLFLAIRTATAQTITGQVTDTDAHPIDGATVVLQTPDSTFVDAAITNVAGDFQFNQQLTAYRLIFQHILYETRQMEVGGSDASGQTHGSAPTVVVLQSKDYELGEVVIKGERPIVKVEEGKLSYDLTQLTENKVVSNAYESLQQLPGVQEINGSLSLAGAHRLSIILNGKPTTMSYEQLVNLLKNTPASRVEKAEVMYSAPPQYHVRGAAINLILKGYHAGEGGLQGEINAGYLRNYKNGAQGGISLLYTTPKWNVDFLYNAEYRQFRQTTDTHSRHTLGDKTYDIYQQGIIDRQRLTHNVRVGAEYKIDDVSNISMAYTGAFNPNNKNHSSSNGNFATSDNSTKGNNQMHNLALDYMSGFGMKAGVNYTSYQSDSNQEFANKDSEDRASRFQTASGQSIDRWKVYLDQSHDLAKDWTLNYGTSFAYAGDHNTQFYHTTDGSDMSALNTDSRYNEYTYDLYAGVSKSIGERLSFSASVTGEYYKMATYHSWSVYPAAELTYVASPAHILQLSFTSDKTYPGYWDLSESTGYISGYEEVQGNPILKPSTDYSANLNYILKNKYIFSVSYDYEPNLFQQLAYQSTDRLTMIYKTLNWDYQQSFSATAIVPFKVGNWLDSRATVQAEYRQAKCDHFFDISFDHSKWIGLGMLQNNITLSSKPDIRMEVTGLYLSPSIQGSYTLSNVWAIHAGLRWNFGNQKAYIQLKAHDIFNSMEGDVDVKLRNRGQYMDMHTNSYSRNIMLSFVYKFGGYKEKQHKQVDMSRFK
ncbi:MAG: TonB-dependent receptor family protein [Bacteroides sp.]|nr:TonB-dependent receptor family protein [Bacteroides sp.]